MNWKRWLRNSWKTNLIESMVNAKWKRLVSSEGIDWIGSVGVTSETFPKLLPQFVKSPEIDHETHNSHVALNCAYRVVFAGWTDSCGSHEVTA
jgi:hypothetical protein